MDEIGERAEGNGVNGGEDAFGDEDGLEVEVEGGLLAGVELNDV